MEREPNSSFQFPPGFRFHPSDEELIVHYLRNKVTSSPLPASIVAEIDLYKYNPWELPQKALFGEDEWYFFSPRDRKYPNGVRPNRSAGSGYWKATGTDKPILTSCGARSIGVKKALVFYIGKAPKGVKTDWMMNEYRLLDTMIQPSRLKGTMRTKGTHIRMTKLSRFGGSMPVEEAQNILDKLDDWVLCRVRKRGNMTKNTCEAVQEIPSTELTSHVSKIEESHPVYTTHNTGMFTDPLYKDFQLIAKILIGQDLPPIKTISSVSHQGNNQGNSCSFVYEDNSEKVNSTITVSSNNFINLSKRKSVEDNLLASNKQITKNNDDNDNNKNEDLPGKTLGNNEMSFYNQNNSQYDFFNPNPLNSIINLQELNDDLAFTERYLQ